MNEGTFNAPRYLGTILNNSLSDATGSPETGAIVVVMQRVHTDDLTGFLLNQSEEWALLSLPAIAVSDEVIPIWGGKTYSRKVGEPLSPEREPLEILEQIKAQLGSDAFSGQYQQLPVPQVA